jgi:hypothetical protein
VSGGGLKICEGREGRSEDALRIECGVDT